MKNIRPIYVMHESGITNPQLNAVLDGIRQLLNIAGITDEIQIHNYGIWKNWSGYIINDRLVPYQSVYWYLRRAQNNSTRTNQLNASTILTDLQFEPWQQSSPHYDIVILRSDIYSGESNNRFIIGLAQPKLGTVISVNRFLRLDTQMQLECIKTEILHELGHAFGLPARNYNIEMSLGKHCSNICVMKQGLRIPDDWVKITNDRRQYGAFCLDCQKNLKEFFSEIVIL